MRPVELELVVHDHVIEPPADVDGSFVDVNCLYVDPL